MVSGHYIYMEDFVNLKKTKMISQAPELPEKTFQKIMEKFNDDYYSGNHTIDDPTYDKLLDIFAEKYPKNPFIQKIGYSVKQNGVKLPFIMGSMNKIKAEKKEDIKKLHKYLNDYPGNKHLSAKIDGVSALLYKISSNSFKLYKRGDSSVGSDISFLIPILFKDVDIKSMETGTAIRGEITIKKSQLSDLNKIADFEYKNPRAAASGLTNKKNSKHPGMKFLKFLAYNVVNPAKKIKDQYDIMTKLGFTTVKNKTIKSSENMEEACSKFIYELDSTYDYEIDGVIINDTSTKYDTVNKNPKNAYAFKIDDRPVETYVKRIIWEITMYGTLIPVLEINPVELNDSTVSRVTAHNAAYIRDHSPGKGAVITIKKSGKIIPKIVDVIKPSTKNLWPDYVEYDWDENETHLKIINANDEYLQHIEIKKIHHFLSTLDIKHIAYKKLCDMAENTNLDIITLFSLNYSNLSKKIKSQVIAKKFIQEVNEKLMCATMDKIMAATTFFPGIGQKRAELIGELDFTVVINNSIKQNIRLIKNIKGFDNTMAKNVANNFPVFFTWVRKLKDTMVQNPSYTKINCKTNSEKIVPYFNEMVVAFSGFRPMPKYKSIILASGGKISEGVTKYTGILFVKGDEQSSKYERALELKIPIKTYDQFINLF